MKTIYFLLQSCAAASLSMKWYYKMLDPKQVVILKKITDEHTVTKNKRNGNALNKKKTITTTNRYDNGNQR